jgi:hypothetical protein
MIILVNPLGNFPLNDDWVYARAVQSILQKGYLDLSTGHTAANLFSQAYWGALFCLPFGFSFTALRFSTLTLGLVGVLATYGLLREAKANQLFSLLGTLLVALNPVYFGLSNTFMTDVPFFAVAALSLYFLISGLGRNSRAEIIVGILLSYIALLIRQLGLAIPLAFSCAYLVKKGLGIQNIIKALLPALLGFFIQIAYQNWLEATGRISPLLSMQAKDTIQTILFKNLNLGYIYRVADNTGAALVYLGLFTFPLIIILFIKKLKEIPFLWQKFLTLFGFSIFFILVMRRLISQNRLMPIISDNILSAFGLGPLTLHDTYFLRLNHPVIPGILKITWIAMTAIGIIGAAILLYYLFFSLQQLFHKHQQLQATSPKFLRVLIVSSIFIYFFPLGLQKFYFMDRYLILLLPLLLMLVIVSTPGISQLTLSLRSISIIFMVMLIYGGFTVGATHDYLSWNQTRWQALNSLVQESHISPRYIDGGYEFDGWYLYSRNYKAQTGKSWWWVDKDDYVISFGSLAGYRDLKRYPVRRWLPFGPEAIFVLQKSMTP